MNSSSRDHVLTDQCQAETESPSLFPCPFCGGKPTVRVRSGAAGVRCVDDDHFVQTYGADLPEAARAWNRRAASSAKPLASDKSRDEQS
jgi:hypothetical protein